MFEDRLRKLRLARKLSQQEVADELGLKVNTYRNYENNEREPTANTLIMIAAYFGVTLDYLLDYHSGNKNSPPPVEDEREAYRRMLSTLSDQELIELKQFTSYLVWKRTHQNRDASET